MKETQDQAGRRLGRRMLPGLMLLACLSAQAPASAQVYKWTDAQGTVHYTDTPPPAQKASQLRPQSAGGAGQNGGQGALPYELARAVKASPVTLYTTTQSGCPGCEQGRGLLRARGIPYTEKTVNTDEDKEQLRRLAGKLELPLLVVGSRKVAGFQDTAWQDALTSAAYPRSAQLPPGYQYAAPESAAAAAAAGVPAPPARAKNAAPPDEAAAQAAEQQPQRPAARENAHGGTPAQKQQPANNAPPGFQF
jgi:glutaredoxin